MDNQDDSLIDDLRQIRDRCRGVLADVEEILKNQSREPLEVLERIRAETLDLVSGIDEIRKRRKDNQQETPDTDPETGG